MVWQCCCGIVLGTLHVTRLVFHMVRPVHLRATAHVGVLARCVHAYMPHERHTAFHTPVCCAAGAPPPHPFQLSPPPPTCPPPLQADNFVPTMTTEETLAFFAALMLPARMSGADKAARVKEVLAALGLSHTAHTLVGAAAD
jgi:hypothetical protein